MKPNYHKDLAKRLIARVQRLTEGHSSLDGPLWCLLHRTEYHGFRENPLIAQYQVLYELPSQNTTYSSSTTPRWSHDVAEAWNLLQQAVPDAGFSLGVVAERTAIQLDVIKGDSIITATRFCRPNQVTTLTPLIIVEGLASCFLQGWLRQFIPPHIRELTASPFHRFAVDPKPSKTPLKI